MARGTEMTLTIFLSASIPLPHRNPAYFDTCDVIAVRDSIRALVTAVLPKGKIVFGGHPAITPLIRLLILNQSLQVDAHVRLFLSRFFEDSFLQEARDFENVAFVEAVDHDQDASLFKMREAMISSEDFSAGIFIGGMEGVEAEFEIFRRIHPRKPAYPIASTGAAARLIYDRYELQIPDLLNNLRYLSLFRQLLQTRG